MLQEGYILTTHCSRDWWSTVILVQRWNWKCICDLLVAVHEMVSL